MLTIRPEWREYPMPGEVKETEFKVFRWNPDWSNTAPIALWLIVGGMLQFARIAGPQALSVLGWLNPLADLMFLSLPILFIKLVRKESLASIGVTRQRIILALIIGLFLGLIIGWFSLFRSVLTGRVPFFPSAFELVAYFVWALFNVAAVEFFYRGWLASNLEKSYGFIPAVFLSALLYSFSFLFLWGTDPTVPAAFSSIGYYFKAVFPVTLFMGTLLAGLARLTRNLLTPILAILPQTIIADLLPGGRTHDIARPEATIIGNIALIGIVAVILWLTHRKSHKDTEHPHVKLK